MKRLGLIVFLCLFFCMILSPSAHADITGPHKIEHPKGVCANCHIPHKAKGRRIWARQIQGDFDGVRQLCHSCHDGTFSLGIDPGNPSSPGVDSGINTVFGTRYESHVMHGAADITRDDWLGTYDQDTFPLDPNDRDNVANHPDDWDSGGAGFYCGSCHDPHIQPVDNGDYLRSKDGFDIGEPENRSAFCKQCHDPAETANSHLESGNCEACHHPHEGYKKAEKGMSANELKIARLTFRAEVVVSTTFTAQPNVPQVTEDPNDLSTLTAAFCYGCHQARHTQGPSDPNYNFWRDAGAAPIYGDQIKGVVGNSAFRRNHHPMGTQAKLTGASFIRAPGADAKNYLNAYNELTCVSCHADLHGVIEGKDYDESKANNFLRWDFVNDKAEFCLKCHIDKNMSGNNVELEILQDERHYWVTTDSPKTRKVYDQTDPEYEKAIHCNQCMFCHFVHDGEERNDEMPSGVIRADIDSLMRVAPINLKWGDRLDDPDDDPPDYEDLCYGCHGESILVGNAGADGSLLQPALYFTHRFASPPEADSPTKQNMTKGGVFPIADGPDPATDTFDDYGTIAGNMFCGSCHNVHAQFDPNSPYLNSGKSPFVTDGFCEGCHNDAGGQFLATSHPIGKGPNPDPAEGSPTADEFVDYYNGGTKIFNVGGSGKPGGITEPYDPSNLIEGSSTTGKVVCLTCHNTHAAVTSWDGVTKTDSNKNHGAILVKDNNIDQGRTTSPGSELCKACHTLGDTQYGFPSGDHGAGNLPGTDYGICNACHAPHGAQGPKLWSILAGSSSSYDLGPFAGNRQLCFTCHYKGSSVASTGIETVFKGSVLGGSVPNIYPEDHVMWSWADINSSKVVYNSNYFPLDTTEQDTIPKCAFSDPNADGFYCGSCHNVHIRLYDGAAYLRSMDGDVGRGSLRKEFCNECHPYVHGGSAGECSDCHKVHLGAVQLCDNTIEGRWILFQPIQKKAFTALPNVQSLWDNTRIDDPLNTDATFCYGCHSPEASLLWSQAGAKPIYGDDDPNSREHHPMGDQATIYSERASIPTDQNYYNAADEVTCKSCHDNIHGPGPFTSDPEKARDNYYLRWKFNEDTSKDQAAFCLACHTDKSNDDLFGKHLVSAADSPNGRGECMFCHFIHDGEERQSDLTLLPNNGIRADVDALMRQPAISLIWKVSGICSDDSCFDTINDTDPYDYEDMCYGCHGDSGIVEGAGENGSLLQPATYFTHRYTTTPDPNSPTIKKIKAGGVFPLSDGSGLKTKDDYGTQAGHIYCGSCHNVHDGRITPYLNHEEDDINLALDNGFCEACHDESQDGSGEFVAMSHPVNVAPNPPVTTEVWKTIYYDGGSGEVGGITGETGNNDGTVICLTCHNVHACATSYNGMVSGKPDDDHGMLLVRDNKETDEGSDMCKDCHPFL